MYKQENGKYSVNFEAGQSRYNNDPVDFMIVRVEVEDEDDWGTDEVELYAEMEIGDLVVWNERTWSWDYKEDAPDTFSILKNEIIRQAIEKGIDPNILEF